MVRLCSFPFKGKAGMGMGFGRDCGGGGETHPLPTRPARRSAPVVRSVRAAVPRKRTALTPLQGRASTPELGYRPALQVVAVTDADNPAHVALAPPPAQLHIRSGPRGAVLLRVEIGRAHV